VSHANQFDVIIIGAGAGGGTLAYHLAPAGSGSSFLSWSSNWATRSWWERCNANRKYFEMGVRDMAQSEAEYPDWLPRVQTDPVRGLENFGELFNKLTNPNGAIKVFCEVANF
jgi:hypothetical protein